MPTNWSRFLAEVAREYVALRTATTAALRALSVDGVEILNTAGVEKRLRAAAIPPWTGAALDVIRSDFGEMIALLVAERLYGTKFTYKSLRDRETVRLPGRGIDAVGIEDAKSGLRLVLGEVKVSDEQKSPPQVVDASKDSLQKQHRAHIKERKETCDKIFNLARHASDTAVRDLLFTAGLLFEQQSESLSLISYSVLVRPASLQTVSDFGSFRKKPWDYTPSEIRFFILCTPDSITHAIDAWYSQITQTKGGAS